MAYSRSILFTSVVSILTEEPQTHLSEISEQLRVSRHTLERVMRREAGCSFREYRRRLLIAKSTELVSDSQLTIKEIAFSLNYQDVGSFSRFVRKITGNRPTELRAGGVPDDE